MSACAIESALVSENIPDIVDTAVCARSVCVSAKNSVVFFAPCLVIFSMKDILSTMTFPAASRSSSITLPGALAATISAVRREVSCRSVNQL